MKAGFALASLLPVFVAAATLPADLQTWAIDPVRSEATFSVRKFWFAHERGTFVQLHGTLRRIDVPGGADRMEVDATVEVARLRMDDPDHRARALGSDFFDATRFPWIRFDSDPFPLDELATGGSVRGVLTLHGEHHPVVFTLQPSACPGQPLACAIRVHGTIKRSTFGMRALRGVLSDKVDLDLKIAVALPERGHDAPVSSAR